MNKTYQITVEFREEPRDFTDTAASRIYTIDGVKDVTITELIPAEEYLKKMHQKPVISSYN